MPHISQDISSGFGWISSPDMYHQVWQCAIAFPASAQRSAFQPRGDWQWSALPNAEVLRPLPTTRYKALNTTALLSTISAVQCFASIGLLATSAIICIFIDCFYFFHLTSISYSVYLNAVFK